MEQTSHFYVYLYQTCLFENDLADCAKAKCKQCTTYRTEHHVDDGRTEGSDHRGHHKEKHTSAKAFVNGIVHFSYFCTIYSQEILYNMHIVACPLYKHQRT